jgi:hypothetical protein
MINGRIVLGYADGGTVNRARINVGNGTIYYYSTSGYYTGGVSTQTNYYLNFNEIVTITSPSTPITVEYYTVTALATNGLGWPSTGSSGPEIYVSMTILQLA